MRDRPLLYWDVDGVISRRGLTPPGCGPEARFELEPHAGYPIPVRIPAGTRDRVLYLCGPTGPFEPRWATTWQNDAATTLAPAVGFGADWAVVQFPAGVYPECETPKLPHLLADAGRRPFAWVDDDLGGDAWFAAEARTAAGMPTLLVSPEEAIGLTDAHVRALIAFAEELLHGPR